MTPPPSHGRSNRRRPFSNSSARPAGQRQAMARRRPAPTFDYRRFENESTGGLAPVAAYVPKHKFADFAFDSRLKHAIATKGYVTPTPIQDQTIPHILAGRDLVGLANTGTGKTAAFILPIINRLLEGRYGTSLILAPTRELAQQIDDEFRSFAAGLKLYSAVCVGGVREGKQIAALRRNPEVVIGTPGRVKQFIVEGQIKLEHCQTFVLDEADRMLDMGFIRDMEFIMDRLPADRRSLCFSATMTREVERIISRLLKDPVTVSVVTPVTSAHINQSVIRTNSREEKLEHLEKLLAQPGAEKVLIFGETKYSVQRLADNLARRGAKATAIHGNKNQNQRQKALDAFKNNQVQVLVATDVAARGLDVPAVTHVVNYDVPNTYEDYVHRIGRTGRAGMGGTALTFIPSHS